MADENRKSEGKQGFIDSLLNPPKCSMLRMIVIGIVGGIVIWGGLNMGMEYTNRSDFCMSIPDGRYRQFRLRQYDVPARR